MTGTTIKGAFGLALMKAEGMQIFNEDGKPYVKDPNAVKTTYVERCVPVEFEDEIHLLIDKFLKARGYDDNCS